MSNLYLSEGEEFSTADKAKLDGLVAGFLGYYATEAALNSAHPTAVVGDHVVVGSTDTVWAWDDGGAEWVDTHSAFIPGIDGNITDNQVAVGATAADNIEGSSAFTWNGTDLKVTGGVKITQSSLERDASRVSSNVKQVWVEADFGTPVGGVITITGPQEFKIMEPIVTANRFVISGNGTVNFVAEVFNIGGITYTGSGTFFTGANVGLLNFFKMTLATSDDSAILFNLTASVVALAQLSVDESLAAGWGVTTGTGSLGVLDGLRAILTKSAFVDTSGITLTNAPDLRFDQCLILNPTGDTSSNMITINGTDSVISRIQGITATMNTNENLFDIDNGIGASSEIGIDGCIVKGAGGAFDATGFDQEDLNVSASRNTGIPDSKTLGEVYLNSSETITISSSGSGGAQIVGGSSWTIGDTEGMTGTTGGRITYNGAPAIEVRISARATLEKVGGGTDLLRYCLYKNGSALPQPCFGTENNAPTSVSISAIVPAVTDDYFEVYVYNNDSTANIVVSQAILEVQIIVG